MAVATNTTRGRYAASISQFENLFSKLSHVVTFEDLNGRKGKPAPDIYLEAAQKFKGEGVKPEECLVFEDTLVGAEAARAAGMQCVMVKALEVKDLAKVGVKQVLSGLQEFRPEHFGLPPFEAE